MPGGYVSVSLTEFAVSPEPLNVPQGAALAVKNDGAVVHNLSVDGTATPMLDSGATADLEISGLAPGTYVMRCDVPGHEAAGMKGTITIE